MLYGSTDLARLLSMQRHTAGAKAALDRASAEMTTGLKADKFKATGGNLARLSSIERMLERNAVHRDTAQMLDQRLDLVQLGLGRVQAATEPLGLDLTKAVLMGDVTSLGIHTRAARQAFDEMLGFLNMRIGDQGLFGGINTDGSAMAPVDETAPEKPPAQVILDRLAALLEPGDTVETALGKFSEAFTAGSDFIQSIYTGATEDLVSAEIGEGQRLAFAFRADDERFLATLKGLAMASLVADGVFDASVPEVRTRILAAAGEALNTGRDGILDLRASVGMAQEAVENARVARQAEKESFELARVRIIAADPYDAATLFQAMQSQLEAVFAITARRASLRFQNFMR